MFRMSWNSNRNSFSSSNRMIIINMKNNNSNSSNRVFVRLGRLIGVCDWLILVD